MFVLIIILVVVFVVVMFIVSTYNSLISSRNGVMNQFSQIDVQLKKRADLVPNLVETVKGYAKHESDTLEGVIKARNSYLSASDSDGKLKANGEFSQAISRVFALSERYPELKANTNFVDLQNQLKVIEDDIESARKLYNDSVLNYNNKIQMFPGNIVALMFKFKKESFFEVTDKERKNVEVKF